ncbi:MAG: hypothetical protein N2D54_03985 [Chloroflexota bacterium]
MTQVKPFIKIIMFVLFSVLLAMVLTPEINANAGTFTDCNDLTDIPKPECEALVDLYNSTAGGGWTNDNGWLSSTTACSGAWVGISCLDGEVSQINLQNNNLAGPIPTSIEDLTNLRVLNLEYNNLTGGIPDQLTNISKLTIVRLNQNASLGGTLPSGLGNLIFLSSFVVNSSNIGGEIPSGLGNLDLMVSFNLLGNNLSGHIPPSVGDMALLQSLNLAGNMLEGSIPSNLGNASSLTSLQLNVNQLSGNLPPSLGNITGMLAIDVSENPGLNWAIPKSYIGMATLTSFFFQETNLCLPPSLSGANWFDNITSTNPASPTLCNPIFADGFESGDVTVWSSAKGKSLGGEVSVEVTCKLCVRGGAAALLDENGLKVRVVNRKVHYVQDSSPNGNKTYNARFYIDINGLKISKGSKLIIFQGRQGKTKVPFFLQVRKYQKKYQIRGMIRTNGGKNLFTKWKLLGNAPVAVEVNWEAGPNGFLKLFVDDVQVTQKTGIKNGKLKITSVRLGVAAPIKPAATISGPFFLDQFGSDSSTHIGK